jgi:hypothetical protein
VTRGDMMRGIAISLLALVALCGCTTLRPHDDVGFGEMDSVRELEGTYANRGEIDAQVPTLLLSSIIWPRDTDMDHTSIEAVNIRALDDVTLVVRALSDTVTVREEQFVSGRDFEFKSGRLTLDVGPKMVGDKAGEAIFGVRSLDIEVGLDERGDGKLRSKSAFIGLAYMVIPIAGGETRHIRFTRIDEW